MGILVNWVTSNAETIITYNTPNIGDVTTTVITYNTSYTTTGNLISQDFTDGTWSGTNQATRHGNGTIAGVNGKYVETEVSQADGGLGNSLSEGFTSKLAADIWFWNSNQQSVIMSQAYTNDAGETTTQTRTVSSNATTAYTNYQDIMSIGANTSTNGSVKVRFDFTHEITSGHRAADVKNPALNLTYGATTSNSESTVKFCWEFNPSTCPQAVEDIADTIVTIEDDLINIIEDIETPDIEIDLPVITYEPETIEVDEPEIISVETVAMIPDVDTVSVLTVPVETNVIEDEITTEELIDAYDTEPVVETATTNEPELETNTNEELPTEEVAMVEPEPELDNGEVVGEETMPVQEDEPVPMSEESTEEIKEEAIEEEIIEEEAVEEEVKEEEVEVAEETVEENTEVNPKMVAMEEYIDSKIDNELQRIEATLTVVSEILSREMKANQVDISSYANINTALFDNRQLNDGNANFFNQIALVGYDRDIYKNQVSLSANDPVVKYTIEVNKARTEVNNKYKELQELINARNGI